MRIADGHDAHRVAVMLDVVREQLRRTDDDGIVFEDRCAGFGHEEPIVAEIRRVVDMVHIDEDARR
jgi:hypothetical protein